MLILSERLLDLFSELNCSPQDNLEACKFDPKRSSLKLRRNRRNDIRYMCSQEMLEDVLPRAGEPWVPMILEKQRVWSRPRFVEI